MAHIHLRCLFDWQKELLRRDLHADVSHCELCHTAYRLPRGHCNAGPSALLAVARAAAAALRFAERALNMATSTTLFEHALSLCVCVLRSRTVATLGLLGFRAGYEWGAARVRRGAVGPSASSPLALVPPALAGAVCGTLCGGVGVWLGLGRLQAGYRCVIDAVMEHTYPWMERRLGPAVAGVVTVGAMVATALAMVAATRVVVRGLGGAALTGSDAVLEALWDEG